MGIKLMLHESPATTDIVDRTNLGDSYEVAAQEGLIAWLKDVGDRFKANLSGTISYKHCDQLIQAIRDVHDFDYEDMKDREAGHPMYSKKQIDEYVSILGPAASEIQSKIIPFFKKAMSCPAKEIEAYYNKKDFSKKDTKNSFEMNDRAAFELWKKIKDTDTDPLRKIMKYSFDSWFYNRQNVKDDWIDLKRTNTATKKYGALGFEKPADFKDIIQLILSERDADKCPIFGKMYKVGWELDKLTYDLLEKRIRGNRYIDLPTGLYNLYMAVNAGVFHTVYTQDRAFWVPAMPMNCDSAVGYIVRRLARVLKVELA